MTDNAEDMRLATGLVDGVAQGLAVDGQALVGSGVLRVPALQGAVEQRRVDAGEHIAEAGAAGDLIAAVAIAATKTCTGLLSQVLGPGADGLIAACPTQHRSGGDGQHGRQGVAAPLRATWIGDIGEERR